jgi:hypothetical protein
MDAAALGTVVMIASACRWLGLTWVGVRVLRIARRTHSAPELLLGVSFLSFSTLGVPLLTLSGYGGAHVSDANVPLLSLALGLLDLGTVCFAAFVARVFRPSSAAGAVALGATALALTGHWLLASRAVSNADPGTSPIQAIGEVELILSVVMSAIFAWGALEAFAYWTQLRRRHALGLADDAALRRMLLFAIGCGSQLAMMAFTMLATVRGTNPLADPVPALGIALTSLGMGVAFALALGAPAARAEAKPAGA